MRYSSSMRHGRVGVVLCTAAASLGVAFSGSASAARVATTASYACGHVPSLGFHDQSGVLAKLGKAYTSQFNGYATPIYKSAYANFKPKRKGGYTVGVVVTAAVSPTQAALIPQLQKQLKTIKGVKKVVLLTTPPTGLTTQIQQVHSLIQRKVNFIVAEPLVPQSFISLAKAAKAAGIPFISIINGTPTPNSINIGPNSVGDTLASGAALAKAIGGKGLVIGVHGVEGTGVDAQSFKGWTDAFKNCPGITFDASVVGDFEPQVAQGALSSYLSSHPQPIAGVVETAGMTSGIIKAFTQAGRPLPVIVDGGPSVGDLVYFKSHPSKLASAFSITPSGVTAATVYTIKQLIAGHGPKLSELVSLSAVMSRSNLSKWIPAGATGTDQSVVEGPWLPSTYLAKLFNK